MDKEFNIGKNSTNKTKKHWLDLQFFFYADLTFHMLLVLFVLFLLFKGGV